MAFNKKEAENPVKHFSAEENRDLGILKGKRKSSKYSVRPLTEEAKAIQQN